MKPKKVLTIIVLCTACLCSVPLFAQKVGQEMKSVVFLPRHLQIILVLMLRLQQEIINKEEL